VDDFLLRIASHPVGARVLDGLGLPAPVELARASGAYEATPLARKTALFGTTPRGRARGALAAALELAGAQPGSRQGRELLDILVFDATGIATPDEARELYDFFHPLVPRIARNGRVLVAAAEPGQANDAVAAAVARGVEGFVRTLAKEIGRRGAQANLAYVAPGAEDRVAAVVRYLCSARSCYVDGQALHVGSSVRAPAGIPMTAVLAGKVALVTGAARGIGEATARRLAEEGARVVCVDLPQAQAALDAVARAVGGRALGLDISRAGAGAQIDAHLRHEHGGVDVVVHNAGITRDRTLAKMSAAEWDEVLGVNLRAIVAIDDALIGGATLRDEGRIVCLSSQSGIAGNFGQSNYATTKAALIGYVAARAPALAPRGITVNAVAPGFIETPMTDAMPLLRRELARRMSSLGQGGLPGDVAELVTLLASPGAFGITGNTIRVCGQSWLGA
jgi:3-oxoacyl-[acyl-carrier protein] reductase